MNGNTPINVYYQNVNGLRTKLNDLITSVNVCLHKIIMFTETNLSPDIPNAELGLHDYTIFRKDRSPLTSAKKSGGGVMIAVHSDFTSSEICSSIIDVEHIFVSTRILNREILFCTAYIPPSSPSDTYSHFCNAVEEVCTVIGSDTTIVMAGDFNQPSVNWMDTSTSEPSAGSQFLINMANFLQLTQVNNVLNSRGVLLDLVFSSDPELQVYPSIDPLIVEESAHPALECVLVGGQKIARLHSVCVPNLNRCNITKVYEWILQQTYPTENSLTDAEALFVRFCDRLRSVILDNCPSKRIGHGPFPGWFSRQLREAVTRKKILHSHFKSTMRQEDYQVFREARKKCKTLSRECYSSYITRVEESLLNNPKTFWSYMRNLKINSSTQSNLNFGDQVAKEPQMMCELFADFFSSIYKTPCAAVPDYSFANNVHLAAVHITATEVEMSLKSLDSSKGPGPDLIPSRVLKLCAEVLAPHLSIHFNNLLRQGVFPHNLKSGFLIPLHKSGPRSDVRNYRPIVIQSALAKLFEKLVLDRMTFAFKNLIIPQQHGFQRGRSTTTNLVEFTSMVLPALSRGKQVDCAYLDFSKAFDRVGHSHLLKKLGALGVSGPLLAWFQSYLDGRTLQVKYAARVSRQIGVLSGVPQGSHLGPFLFCLFINDIGITLSNQYILFADDVKIFAEVSCIQHQFELQRDLQRIQDWCQVNGMDLNIDKCNIMSYNRAHVTLQFNYMLHGVTLRRVTTVRDLGVLLTPALDFSEHIHGIVNKAVSILGFICRTCRHSFSAATVRALYVVLVRPVLEFSCVVWSPYQVGHISLLESVQSRVFRAIGVKLGYRYLEVDLEAMSNFLHLPPLSVRRTMMDLAFLFKVLNGSIDCPAILHTIELHVPRHHARNVQLFTIRHHLTNYLYHSTIPRLMRTGNRMCSEVDFFDSSLRSFKRSVQGAVIGHVQH